MGLERPFSGFPSGVKNKTLYFLSRAQAVRISPEPFSKEPMMASRRIPSAKKPPAAPACDDLEILAPDREIVIGGEKITVHELTFGEQLKHGVALKALADAVLPRIDERMAATTQGQEVTLALDAFAENREAVIDLVAVSSGLSRERVESLRPAEGEALFVAFWEANHGFFIRRLVRGLPPERLAVLVGGASLPASSATDTREAN
jgi:hypothetical protein